MPVDLIQSTILLLLLMNVGVLYNDGHRVGLGQLSASLQAVELLPQ